MTGRYPAGPKDLRLDTSVQLPVVRDHVRVRQGVGQAPTCEELPHHPDEQGRTGVVVAIRAQPGAPRHPYLVMFDQPHPKAIWRGVLMPIAARHYAADELEVIGREPRSGGAITISQRRSHR